MYHLKIIKCIEIRRKHENLINRKSIDRHNKNIVVIVFSYNLVYILGVNPTPLGRGIGCIVTVVNHYILKGGLLGNQIVLPFIYYSGSFTIACNLVGYITLVSFLKSHKDCIDNKYYTNIYLEKNPLILGLGLIFLDSRINNLVIVS